MIYLNFVQVPDLTAFITKRVFGTVIMCLSTIVTYHVKKCASVAVIVYLMSKTFWSYKILNTHYHRHIMQIIANYTDLCQITATIRKKDFIDHPARNPLVSKLSLLLFTYSKVPDFYIAEYWLQTEKTNIKTVSLKHYQIPNMHFAVISKVRGNGYQDTHNATNSHQFSQEYYSTHPCNVACDVLT